VVFYSDCFWGNKKIIKNLIIFLHSYISRDAPKIKKKREKGGQAALLIFYILISIQAQAPSVLFLSHTHFIPSTEQKEGADFSKIF
jgi:hypothetical protein